MMRFPCFQHICSEFVVFFSFILMTFYYCDLSIEMRTITKQVRRTDVRQRCFSCLFRLFYLFIRSKTIQHWYDNDVDSTDMKNDKRWCTIQRIPFRSYNIYIQPKTVAIGHSSINADNNTCTHEWNRYSIFFVFCWSSWSWFSLSDLPMVERKKTRYSKRVLKKLKFKNKTFLKIQNYYEISVMEICSMNSEQTADLDQSLANWTKRLCLSPTYGQIPNVKNNLSNLKNISICIYIYVRKALKIPPPKYLMFTNLFCF